MWPTLEKQQSYNISVTWDSQDTLTHQMEAVSQQSACPTVQQMPDAGSSNLHQQALVG